MIQGVILFSLILADVLTRYRIRFERRLAIGLMDLTNVLAAGVATGTVLLFAAIGEIFAERAGVLNLGVEGMMLFGAVAGLLDRRRDRQPVARRARGDAGRRPAQPGPRGDDHLVACRPGRLRARADVPRDRAWRASSARASRARRTSRCIPQVTIPVLSEIPFIGADLLHRPAGARLRRLPARAARLVLDRPDAAGPPPARRRRVPGRRRRPGDRRLPAALRLRLHRRDAGRAGRGDHHARHLTGLVRRPDRPTGAAGSPSGS